LGALCLGSRLPRLPRLGGRSPGCLRAGLQRHGIGFRQITVTSLRNVRDDAAWTADLVWIRDTYPNMRGTPWFFLVSGRTIEAAANSTDLWRMKFAPMAA